MFTTRVPLRWGDMDSLGHVNNAVVVTLLEEGRVRFLTELGDRAPAGIGSGFGLVAARHEIDYLRPLYYSPEPVELSVWIDRIGTASFTVGCEIAHRGEPAVRAKTVVVATAADGRGSTPLPEAAREALSAHLRA